LGGRKTPAPLLLCCLAGLWAPAPLVVAVRLCKRQGPAQQLSCGGMVGSRQDTSCRARMLIKHRSCNSPSFS